MPMMRLVTVLSSADPIGIGMAKDVLDSAGVRCVVEGGSASSFMEAQYGAAFAGALELRVREDDAVRAAELIERAFGDETNEA
jgi:hypothetical protein